MSKQRVEVDGRTAFVSGAASGMGRAVAVRLAAHGCPGGVKTNIARNARYHAHPLHPGLSHEDAARQFDAMAFTTPERAAKTIHAGVKAGRVLVGPDAYMFDALARLMPTRYFDVLAFLDGLVARRG